MLSLALLSVLPAVTVETFLMSYCVSGALTLSYHTYNLMLSYRWIAYLYEHAAVLDDDDELKASVKLFEFFTALFHPITNLLE